MQQAAASGKAPTTTRATHSRRHRRQYGNNEKPAEAFDKGSAVHALHAPAGNGCAQPPAGCRVLSRQLDVTGVPGTARQQNGSLACLPAWGWGARAPCSGPRLS